MSRQTQARRWSVERKRRQLAAMTEESITPEEARTALNAIVLQTGHILEDLEGYDCNKDRFHCACRNADMRKVSVWVPGESVAKVVAVARTLKGVKRLGRKSEKARVA